MFREVRLSVLGRLIDRTGLVVELLAAKESAQRSRLEAVLDARFNRCSSEWRGNQVEVRGDMLKWLRYVQRLFHDLSRALIYALAAFVMVDKKNDWVLCLTRGFEVLANIVQVV